jgi:hypothetical protein
MDKIDKLKLQSCQTEALAIMHEFRKALNRHFEVVNANALRLINGRWDNNE